MMNIKQYSILGTFLITTLMWSTTSSASILGIYAGISAGQAEIENTSPTQDSTAGKVYAGYRILGPIAIEVSRVDLGEFGTAPIASIDGTALDLVLYLPAGLVNVFAKVGVFDWSIDYNDSTLAQSGTDSKFGFGVEYNLLLNVDLRLELETYTGVGGSGAGDINVISIGANIAF